VISQVFLVLMLLSVDEMMCFVLRFWVTSHPSAWFDIARHTSLPCGWDPGRVQMGDTDKHAIRDLHLSCVTGVQPWKVSPCLFSMYRNAAVLPDMCRSLLRSDHVLESVVVTGHIKRQETKFDDSTSTRRTFISRHARAHNLSMGRFRSHDTNHAVLDDAFRRHMTFDRTGLVHQN
jgi:hypothetical protein